MSSISQTYIQFLENNKETFNKIIKVGQGLTLVALVGSAPSVIDFIGQSYELQAKQHNEAKMQHQREAAQILELNQ